MIEGKLSSASRVVMTQLVLPSHTNSLGSIFGGTVMSWIDIAAAIAAQRHSNLEVVTASIDRLDFVAPVYKGWVVNLKASVNFTSKTSMEVGVRVDAENPKTGASFHTASAYLTFVGLGENGKPTLVPPVIPETADDQRRYQEAQQRRTLRLKNRTK
ncbi:MAG: acyl-CoA thioesterase [Bdellovibrionia bacterium]